MRDFFFFTTMLCCLVRQTLSMSRQSLLYSLSLAELFVATLNPWSRPTCLGSSHLSSIFYRDRNLLLHNFYCYDRDFYLRFFILSQHEFLCRNILFVIFPTSVATIFVFVATKFISSSCCVCRGKVFLSPILSLNVALRHKICLGLDIRWNVYRNIEILCRDNFVMLCLIVLLFSIVTELSFVAIEFI